MIDLDAYRDQVIADLKALLANVPGARIAIESHPGRFELAELEHYSSSAPAIRVAVLSSRESDLDDSGFKHDVALGLYLITKRGKAGAQDRQMLKLSSLTMRFIKGYADFGGDFAARRPRGIEFNSLYTAQLDEGAGQISLGAIKFQQLVDLGLTQGSLGDFITLANTYHLGDGDEPEATDSTTLPQ